MSETATDVATHQDLYPLPDDWSWTPLGDICDAINGRAFKSTEWREAGVPIIRIQNLKDPSATFNYFQGDLSENHQVRSGDLLFAWSGTPGTSFGAHIWRGPDAALNQHIFNVRFDRAKLDTKYFCYALNQNVSRYVEQAQGGVGLAHITKSKFMASMIPVAPLDQQKRIVAEIEKQFSCLDEAVASLKRVKANLKRYKAAVLKAAVEGRLVETEAGLARREGRSYETGAQLLQRILETRRSQWQGKGKYKEPAAPDTTNLPELPEGWVWASADQLMSLITDGEHITPLRSESGVLLLSARNVLNGQLDLSVVDYVPEEEHLRLSQRFSVMAGDVLLSCSGSVGRSCVVPNGAKFSLVRSVAVLRPVVIPANFVCYQIQSPLLQSQIATRKTQTAQANIFQGKIRQLVFALPPEVEQQRIVAEVDRRLSLLRETEAQVDANLLRAECLRQSILMKAFKAPRIEHAMEIAA